jgi:hypothetical protein
MMLRDDKGNAISYAGLYRLLDAEGERKGSCEIRKGPYTLRDGQTLGLGWYAIIGMDADLMRWTRDRDRPAFDPIGPCPTGAEAYAKLQATAERHGLTIVEEG